MLPHCPACGSATADPFFEADSVPVFCNVLWDDADAARSARRGDITLRACPECRLVFNGAFEPALLEYGPRYENSLHCSPHFQEFADALARRLIDRFGLRDEVVLEIGCGRGEFLGMLCRLGANHGVGFDQSFDPEVGLPEPGDGTIAIETEPFPASADGLEPALTLCRHVLEHIPEPGPFVAAMVGVAGRRPGGGVYVEVPNVLYTLRDLGIWDIIYEHCAYYSAASLTRLLAGAGVAVTDAREDYGGQFLCVEGRASRGAPAGVDGSGASESGAGRSWEELVTAFAEHQREKVAEWSERLEEMRSRRGSVALWGAGSKGVMFLNMVRGTDAIGRVIDLNPRKQGRYTAGTGHRIDPPTALVDDPPATVLVMNPLYVDEIRDKLHELGLDPVIEQV